MSKQDERKASNGPANGSPNGNDPAASTRESRDAGPSIGDHIGRELRAMFDEVVAEPVPDRLRKLLDDLARKPSKD